MCLCKYVEDKANIIWGQKRSCATIPKQAQGEQQMNYFLFLFNPRTANETRNSTSFVEQSPSAGKDTGCYVSLQPNFTPISSVYSLRSKYLVSIHYDIL
jgi:hypothetical protein